MSSVGESVSRAGSVVAVGSGGAGLTPYVSDLISILGVVIGLIIAFMGYMVNKSYKKKQDQREQEYHEARMRALKDD